MFFTEQIRATRALVTFCEQHKYPSAERLQLLRECVSALAEEDIARAIAINMMLPAGGNGSFADWWPPAVAEGETEEYTWAVFEALVTRWKILMNLLR